MTIAVPTAAMNKYHTQRSQAKSRGIPWEFTPEEWWQMWSSSGKWEQRGRRADQFVMARNGDTGPYSPGNVRIVTVLENARERVANGRSPLGSGKGWKIDHKARTRPYEARIAGRTIGMFATQEEAESAYKKAAQFLLSAWGQA